MRGFLLLALLLVAAVVLTSIARTLTRGPRRPAPARRDELVKDPVCQTYVVRSRALRSETGGVTTYFCSRQCADRYARGEART